MIDIRLSGEPESSLRAEGTGWITGLSCEVQALNREDNRQL